MLLLPWVFFVNVVHGLHLHGPPGLKHVEEVLNFRMVGFKEGPGEIEHGHKQSHADDLHISFSAFDKEWNFEVSVDHGLFSETSRFEFHDDDGMHTLVKPDHTIYQTKEGTSPSATFSIHDAGTVHAQIMTDEGPYTIDPAHEFPEFNLKNAMGMYHHSHLFVKKELHSQDASRSLLQDIALNEQKLPYVATTKSVETTGQKLPQSWVTGTPQCYPTQATPKKFAMGIAVTHEYYKLVGKNTQATIQTDIKQLLADSNTIYQPQMNVRLYVEKAIIKTAPGLTNAPWNMAQLGAARNSGCGETASETLAKLRIWRMEQHPTDAGLWHLMTTCFPAPGTVGIAYLNAICDARIGSGLSSTLSARNPGSLGVWKVVAHEIGHNFGADHSFELGQGKTGGIMDYGDGLLNGAYQFNTQFRRTQVCARIATSQVQSIPSNMKCWSNYVATGGKVYKWVAGTSVCGGTCGQTPTKTTPFICRECTTPTGTCVPTGTIASAEGKCSPPKPQPKIETTNTGCPTVQCVCGNGKVEANEECDTTGDPCCVNCKIVQTTDCQSKTGGMDACFVSVKYLKTYCFKGNKYIRYTPTAQGSMKADDTYPRETAKHWPGLSFTEGIDAIVQRREGRIYFIKGLKYSVYEMGFGAHVNKSLDATAFFGLPATWKKVDAAVSLNSGQGGAYLFSDQSYCRFNFDRTTLCKDAVRTINDWSQPDKFPMAGISAARRYWDGLNIPELRSVVDLMWQNKFVQFQFGRGLIKRTPIALPDSGINKPVSNLPSTSQCKMGCLTCSSQLLCDKCEQDFVLISRVCYPKEYVVEMLFDANSEVSDKKYVLSNQVVSWNTKTGVTGKAVEFAPTGFIQLNPNKIATDMKDFEFHFWVNIKVGTTGTVNLCALDISKSSKVMMVSFHLKPNGVSSWYPTVTITHSLYGTMKTVTLSATYPVVHSKWKHLIVTFKDGNAKLTTDGSEIILPYDDAQTSGYDPNAAWVFKSFHIGKSAIAPARSFNGINGYMDQFHIDRLTRVGTEPSAAANTGTLSLLAVTFLCFFSSLPQLV